MPILALTSNADTARQMQGYMKSVKSVLVNKGATEAILKSAIDSGKAMGWCATGDSVVCVHGSTEGFDDELTNLLRVLRV